MSKLAGIKEKISKIQASLNEKLDKIAFIKKWREKPAGAAAGPGQKTQADYSLGTIYRDGSVGTRLQVILVVLFFIGAALSTGYVAKKMLARFKTTSEQEQLKKDYAHGFEDLKDRVQANASIISIGELTSIAYVGGDQETMVRLDVWARVSNADAAAFADKNNPILYDKVVEALTELRKQKVNVLSIEGKKTARLKIKEHLNKVMKNGKVEEIFFHNLLSQ